MRLGPLLIICLMLNVETPMPNAASAAADRVTVRSVCFPPKFVICECERKEQKLVI